MKKLRVEVNRIQDHPVMQTFAVSALPRMDIDKEQITNWVCVVRTFFRMCLSVSAREMPYEMLCVAEIKVFDIIQLHYGKRTSENITDYVV